MKKLALCLILVAVGAIAWRARTTTDGPDAKLLFDRLWVERMPRTPTETIQALWVNGERPFGMFQTRTAWTGQWEGFHYHVAPREDGVIDLLFGATREQQRVRYTARACTEGGFDLCLELSGTTRGVRRYYSKKEWRFAADQLDRADDALRALPGR